jgi:tRNA(fMet)-specific endonuclease VapC
VINSSLYVLDTNTATYIVSGRSPAARQSLKAEREHSTVALSAITQAEILFGLENKPEATRLRAAVEELFDAVQILAWDSNAARAYGKLRARISAAGKTLTAMDMLIAAHAVAANATLVTHDKAFLQITPFLNAVDWATDL